MTASHPDSGWKTAIVMLAGPIKYWWDDNWDTPEHWRYADWRDRISQALVKAGYLVYHPHAAFKGAWDERAQAVNDTALRTADVILNLTPPGVPSQGTDGEVLFAAGHGKIILPAPPTDDVEAGIVQALEQLDRLNLRREAVMQTKIIESLDCQTLRPWMAGPVLAALIETFAGFLLRVHHTDHAGRIEAVDATGLTFDGLEARLRLCTAAGHLVELTFSALRKIEVLG